MPKKLETILFCLLLLNGKNIQCKSLDEQLGSKYQFNLFENEEGCKSVYKFEEILVKKLFEMRENLDIIKIKIQQFRQFEKFQHGVKKHLEEFFHYQRKTMQDINKMTNEFPTIQDDNGRFKKLFSDDNFPKK